MEGSTLFGYLQFGRANGAPGPSLAKVSVESEQQVEGGWVFVVAVERDSAPPNPPPPRTEHEVTLSWVDYEYWSHGAVAPEKVAQRVVEALLRDDPFRELPQRFDASTARRWMRSLDATMETLL